MGMWELIVKKKSLKKYVVLHFGRKRANIRFFSTIEILKCVNVSKSEYPPNLDTFNRSKILINIMNIVCVIVKKNIYNY